MNRDEIEELLTDICPQFTIRKDNSGQLIIHTGLIEDECGELTNIDHHEDDDDSKLDFEDLNELDFEDD